MNKVLVEKVAISIIVKVQMGQLYTDDAAAQLKEAGLRVHELPALCANRISMASLFEIAAEFGSTNPGKGMARGFRKFGANFIKSFPRTQPGIISKLMNILPHVWQQRAVGEAIRQARG